MEIKCRCGGTCIKPAPEILNKIELLYMPCSKCKIYKLKKFSPLIDQININKINNVFERCSCGKRHLDIVIAHILKIMIEEGIKDRKSSLRDTCTPLITPAFPFNFEPYLFNDSLVILSDNLTSECAHRIINEVDEVKGALKGNLKETVGLKDINFNPNTYEVLAGCDMRCDVVQTPYGNLCIHKSQGKTHIEFPRPKSPKIDILSSVIDKYDSPSVIDCTCGPGTLGITCLKSGARKVVFNDIWFPAVEMTAINLEANGFPVTWHPEKDIIAEGTNFKVYSMDIRKLDAVIKEKYDICLVDAFPNVDTTEFEKIASKLCKKVIII